MHQVHFVLSLCRNVPAVWPGSFECMFRNNGNLRRAIVLKTHRILLHYEIYEFSNHLFVKVVFLFILRRVKMLLNQKELADAYEELKETEELLAPTHRYNDIACVGETPIDAEYHADEDTQKLRRKYRFH